MGTITPSRLAVTLMTALALAAPAVAATVGTSGPAASDPGPSLAAAAEPAVTFLAPGKAEGRPFVEGQPARIDFGLYLRADAVPFELWSTRASYADPIRTEWRSSTGTGEVWPGTVMKDDFSGLREFLHVKISDADGRTVKTFDATVCLNGVSGIFVNLEPFRALPDAPATSPYPRSCPRNVYALGSVQGIQAGWAAPLLYKGILLDRGRYTVQASIAPRFRELLGLSAAGSRKKFPLIIGPPFQTSREHSASKPTERRPEARPRKEPAARSAGAPAGPMVDLRSLPPFEISLTKSRTQLEFSATTWNAGDSPLVLEGFRDEGEDHMTAYQYFYDAVGNETGHLHVGRMHFHGGHHQHWHFLDFARYRLLYPDGTLAAPANKQSWCLANTDAVDYTRPGAQWRPENTDLYSSCGRASALSIREVLEAGSGDTYRQFQTEAFDVGNLPNGKYILSVEANPSGRLLESDATNNEARRTVWLRGHGPDRRVLVAPVGIVKER